jgi:Na+-translocating ferredoxin:NAD+ oxidoreductase RnfD subunit
MEHHHGSPAPATSANRRDPRLYQIACLGLLLLYGLGWLHFDLSIWQAGITIGIALLTQYAGTRLANLPFFDPKSALISSLSLCLLLRTHDLTVAALGAFIAIGSKFLFRWNDKHLFNPTNLALSVILASGLGWISPGQWGQATWFAFLIACLGSLVVTRAARADVTLAFLTFYVALLFARAFRLGDPYTIPIHQLESATLLIFAFFMISDPKTTPDSHIGRIIYALLVSLAALYVQFGLFRPNGPLWGLIACAPLVPLIDYLLPGARYHWTPSSTGRSAHSVLKPVTNPIPALSPTKEVSMRRAIIPALVLTLGLLAWAHDASAFCGFYVGKADTKLFNKASEVAIARHDNKTVITMANDFKGDVKEFALVVPVPTILEKEQIHVGDPALLKHLADYSAPRLVEYFDQNPCLRYELMERRSMDAMKSMAPAAAPRERDKVLGVTVEAQYTVGEYDILILSAKESSGLETWLTENGYRIPQGASAVLQSYLKQRMKFFVAKVNLGEQAKLGLTHLRPLQIAFESPKFMLPIRLGTVNADGAQELFIYFLTKQGRVETTNYRTVRLPDAQEIPLFVKDKFGDFYRDLFGQQVKRESERGVFVEYAWDMNWCDPCAADPLSTEELRSLGVFWQESTGRMGKNLPMAQNVFLTRLHVRYDAAHFPEDLMFQETSDRGNFQARYILRHPWTGTDDCSAAAAYRLQLRERYEREAQALASLTGWNISEIRKTMNIALLPDGGEKKWYEHLWGN